MFWILCKLYNYCSQEEKMRILILTSVIVLVVVIAMTFLVKRRGMTLEQKLELLADGGLKLAEPFTTNDLLVSWVRKEYEKPGFNMVLVGLGMTEEQEPWRNHCVNLWHFDTECIEDHGNYKKIAERMAELTQDSLHLENIRDYVDVENEVAWFSFSFKGQEIKVECKVEDDWVDTIIFAKFVELLNTADPSKVYIYYDLGGQDCIIGCVSKGELSHFL